MLPGDSTLFDFMLTICESGPHASEISHGVHWQLFLEKDNDLNPEEVCKFYASCYDVLLETLEQSNPD
jgi:hypothetical protein